MSNYDSVLTYSVDFACSSEFHRLRQCSTIRTTKNDQFNMIPIRVEKQNPINMHECINCLRKCMALNGFHLPYGFLYDDDKMIKL